MCTVTIIPIGKYSFILTSNRDEAPNRVSLPPANYAHRNTEMLYPKDVHSGGTWIGVSDKNRVLCVLNGAFTFHERKPSYRLSRGIIAKDLLAAINIEDAIAAYNLEDVEPFTLVIADWNNNLQFMELVWDGLKKHFCKLPLEPRIWSSSSLYSETMKQKRLQWFETHITHNNHDAASLLHFHKTTGKGNDDYGVIMDRGFVKTTSITQIEKCEDQVTVLYDGLDNSSTSKTNFSRPLRLNE